MRPLYPCYNNLISTKVVFRCFEVHTYFEIMQKGAMDWVVSILLIVGALNWGLVGLLNLDVVASIFGGTAALGSKVVYVLVGLAGLWKLVKLVGVMK